MPQVFFFEANIFHKILIEFKVFVKSIVGMMKGKLDSVIFPTIPEIENDPMKSIMDLMKTVRIQEIHYIDIDLS